MGSAKVGIENRMCYLGEQKEKLKLLPDISDEVKPPRPGRAIFFHETSCAVDHNISLNAR